MADLRRAIKTRNWFLTGHRDQMLWSQFQLWTVIPWRNWRRIGVSIPTAALLMRRG